MTDEPKVPQPEESEGEGKSVEEEKPAEPKTGDREGSDNEAV